MKRKIIKIDHELCNGCGLCIPNCPEGAIQLIDGKARLVSDLLCDGLGACLGHCPEGAIAIEEREAEPYDERKVMAMIIPQGMNTIRAHLAHLRDHGELEYLRQAEAMLAEQGISVPAPAGAPAAGSAASLAAAPAASSAAGPAAAPHLSPAAYAAGQFAAPAAGLSTAPSSAAPAHAGCPGSRSAAFAAPAAAAAAGPAAAQPSQLTHWPIQLHLISPAAGHFAGSDLLIAADCTAFSLGAFHQAYLAGKTLIIACPKLDDGQEIYREKIRALIDQAQVRSITVMIMQVPCCGGLLRLVQAVMAESSRRVPLRLLVVGIHGEILRDEWAATEK